MGVPCDGGVVAPRGGAKYFLQPLIVYSALAQVLDPGQLAIQFLFMNQQLF